MNVPRPKRIFIIDDHPMFRRGLIESLTAEADLAVCGEASGEAGTLQAVLEKQPDLVVLDVTLRGTSGMELLKELLAARGDLLILMVSMHDEALYAERALRAGARGYIMKHEEPERIVRCVRQVLRGELYLSESASSAIIQNLTGRPGKASRFAVDQLSEREFEVFELLAEGRTTNEIAERLQLNARTVVVHYANIRRKLNVKHGPELLAYSVRWKESGGRRTPGGTELKRDAV
jgi:DNA-binding NarL/FixJ family response regulator